MQEALAAVEWIAAATSTPTPSSTVDPDLVTPGPEGFAVMALVALAVIVLIADMMRRIRRGRVRADINEELDAEQEAREQAERADTATEVDDQSTTGGDGESPRS